MKVVGQVFKREKYQGRKGEGEKVVLLDLTPEGRATEQFIEIPGDATSAKVGEFVEFDGRTTGRLFMFPDSGGVKVVKR